jgi:hypothetical protein
MAALEGSNTIPEIEWRSVVSPTESRDWAKPGNDWLRPMAAVKNRRQRRFKVYTPEE